MLYFKFTWNNSSLYPSFPSASILLPSFFPNAYRCWQLRGQILLVRFTKGKDELFFVFYLGNSREELCSGLVWLHACPWDQSMWLGRHSNIISPTWVTVLSLEADGSSDQQFHQNHKKKKRNLTASQKRGGDIVTREMETARCAEVQKRQEQHLESSDCSHTGLGTSTVFFVSKPVVPNVGSLNQQRQHPLGTY